jgi:hypothetical protein
MQRIRAKSGCGPGPRPQLGAFDETGSNRVLDDVLARAFVVVVALDQPRREAPLKEMAGEAVTIVEVLRMPPVQLLHPL